MFSRPPDRDGLLYWVGRRWAGLAAKDAAYWMSQGPEFRAAYGAMDDGAFVDTVYANLLGRNPDPEGRAYWGELVIIHGRANVLSWMTQAPEFALVWPYTEPSLCEEGRQLGLSEASPGIEVGRHGSTVTVVADRGLVRFRAVNGTPNHAHDVAGDVVANANWFTAAGPVGPVVSDGRVAGGPDLLERGQIVSWRPGCDGRGNGELEHIWTWRVWTPDPCALDAVSGVSLVHQGRRADSYPGVNLVAGGTNTSTAHSFVGFNDSRIIVVSSYQLNASRLADYAISLGAQEGVMLDGGLSTQIKTPSTSLTTARAVPSFVVVDSLAGH
jgi:Domain of unknown function (DUF4214)/Phosphodiester glycosidase